MSAGAEAAGRLLDEAHLMLRHDSPAREVTAALRLAHGRDPRAGLRTLLRADRRGGAR